MSINELFVLLEGRGQEVVVCFRLVSKLCRRTALVRINNPRTNWSFISIFLADWGKRMKPNCFLKHRCRPLDDFYFST